MGKPGIVALSGFQRMRGSPVVGASLAQFAILLVACSCHGPALPNDGGDLGDATARPRDAGQRDGGSADATADSADAGIPDASGPDVGEPPPYPPGKCSQRERPESVPAGWQRYDGYSCDCPVYIPGPTGEPPPPIEWEDCPDPIPANLRCRRMKKFWGNPQTPQQPALITAFPRFWRSRETGKAYLQFGRVRYYGNEAAHYRLVAELDGPVRVAFFEPYSNKDPCHLYDSGISDGRYLFGVWGEGIQATRMDAEGYIAGAIGETYPRAVVRETRLGEWNCSYTVSSEWIVRLAGDWSLRVTSWDKQVSHDVPRGVAPNWPFAVGPDVFWKVERGVASWNPGHGTRILLGWPDDRLREAGKLGTDGETMVWTEHTGIGTEDERGSIMTAPHSADPAVTQGRARRLRSDLGAIDTNRIGTGCGYAAHDTVRPRVGGLQIVRLADGVSWLIPRTSEPGDWMFGPTLGFTCDVDGKNVEVVNTLMNISAWRDPMTVVRIPIDALGPGMPPD